ncbi:MAG: cupin domain-containing protein [Planctomycetales bacterium]|nr:cupin domain-containing protein [Planctomycetales bacterium]NIM09391.1 cupin domain-containing protein [Planctomycetales bacterium]NIN08861.1 cupin domain-containing protein [Planctomycetales bacterium]NIN77978.1 cupin domain-containing protein [Planctomycetales bacterium]NIO35161.1 cupin domain-containing protein [Planctomycetales bacterium]
MEGSAGCRVRWLVDEKDGAPNFAMRQFDVAPGGHTPRHSHPYEHEIYVLEGAGEVIEGDQPRPLKAGDVVYVAPDDVHQFRNTGTTTMKFLCMVPHIPEGTPVKVLPECAG